MIAFTGPKIAMLVASVSFLTIAGSVITVSKVDSKILRQSHQKNTYIYGTMFYHDFFSWFKIEKIQFDGTGKTFKCRLSSEYFDCLILPAEKDKDHVLIQHKDDAVVKALSSKTDIFKIVVPREKMKDWKTTHTIQIKITGASTLIKYAGFKAFFAVDEKILSKQTS